MIFGASICSFLLLSTAHARQWPGSDNDSGTSWWLPPIQPGRSSGVDSNGKYVSPSLFSFFDGSSSAGYQILVTHAVMASAVWILFVPLGGILLRLNIRSPRLPYIHAAVQTVSYLLYIAAAALGIYLVRRLSFQRTASLWHDAHPRLGLAILALALFQPIFGFFQHRLFKKRVAGMKAGVIGPAPGRTLLGHIHLWLGRLLIVLGMINGGLGIRLADRLPFQSAQETRTAGIIYGTLAGLVLLLYLVVIIKFEFKGARRAAKSIHDNDNDDEMSRTMASSPFSSPPVRLLDEVPLTYLESQESIRKEASAVTRYG